MWGKLLEQIYNLKWIVLVYVVLGIAISFLITLCAKKFGWNRRKIQQYAFLYAMNDRCLVAYAFSLGRMVYVFCLAAVCSSLGLESFIVLLLLTAVICITAKDFKGLPGQIVTYACLFGLLLLESMFESYYREVEAFWLIRAMVLFLGIFSVLYALYHQLVVHERLLRISFGDNDPSRSMDVPMNINDFKSLFRSGQDKEGVSIIDVQKKA